MTYPVKQRKANTSCCRDFLSAGIALLGSQTCQFTAACLAWLSAGLFAAPGLAQEITSPSATLEPAVAWDSQRGIVVVVGDPYVDVYSYPGRGYPRFHVVEKKQRMRIFKQRTGWFKVETQDGKLGWVRQRDLKTVYDTDGYLLDFSLPHWNEASDPVQFGLSGTTFSDYIGYSVHAGYRFTPNISGELRYTHGFGDFSHVKSGTINLLHQPFPHWRYSPYFVLGAGVMRTFPETILVNAEDEEDNLVTVGGGLMVYLSHKVVARFEYNHHTMLTTRESNEEVEEWKAGFSVLF